MGSVAKLTHSMSYATILVYYPLLLSTRISGYFIYLQTPEICKKSDLFWQSLSKSK